MRKNILIISSSLSKTEHTLKLCKQFEKGAIESLNNVELMNLWVISPKISWLNKERTTGECLLDKDGNVTMYSNKLIETYSNKRKYSRQLSEMAQIHDNDNLSF